ncbi:glycerophosphodiester phosphodiesterase [Vagococcus zengguangii]|uniref:Glycerophosphodiester phosphodiesterase n=1 Tax=Vagococcus zengguangii TaxID=2571750 RepID=A0A4D7CZZ5_9ENTE|nr:glycerophosphodiester phosphodiesterase [Vagococcus zengguangii]QCI87086.1 glycerophosphodiester phosphodiesterase [Vagococcus zengguangii]
MKTQVFAHRGSKGTHPENTLPAFEEAVLAGADGIELDVHLSKDGNLMVIHDETIDRTTNGTGRIMDLTKKEIQSYNAGSWFSEVYDEIVVPTLEEVTYFLKQLNFKGMLNIEVKTDKIHYEGIEVKIHEWMTSEEWPFDFMYSTFNPKSLAILEQTAPETPNALITFADQEMIDYGLMTRNIGGIHPKINWLEEHPEQLAGFAKALRPWTVNKKSQMLFCFKHQIAGIMTDYPRKAVTLRNECQK